MIKLASVESFISKNSVGYDTTLKHIEGVLKTMIANNVPIYLFKSRIKKPDSLYLKIKRKNLSSTKDATDVIGIRVLCLFENDLINTHSATLSHFVTENKYKLLENIFYNFNKSIFDKFLRNTDKVYHKYIKLIEKPSGYKSVHYIFSFEINKKKTYIELQLRTLIQDVWGELEHALSYKKGGVHPHIKKSFELLSSDLETVDNLMTHLKDIHGKEEAMELYSKGKSRPRHYFDYEINIIPTIFKNKLHTEFNEYSEFTKNINYILKTDNIQESINEAIVRYNNIIKILTTSNSKIDKKLEYWMEMERAFFEFCNYQYDTSLSMYNNLLKNYPNKYCIHYRIGEIYLSKGNVTQALASFDEAEYYITKSSAVNQFNLYNIQVMLALLYWMLGEEYIDIAIEKINKAELIFKREKRNNLDFQNIKKSSLDNNMCWYYLVKFITSKKKVDFNNAEKKFTPIQKFIESDIDSLSANTLDTAAWYYYNRYLHKKNDDDLNNAARLCEIMRNKVNYSSYNFTTMHVQMNHIKEILGAWKMLM